MKRVRAICCAVLAGLMLAGCAVQPQTDNKRGGGAAVDLTKYVVREAAYPAYPKEPRFEDYFDENGDFQAAFLLQLRPLFQSRA